MHGTPQEVYDDWKQQNPEEPDGCSIIFYILFIILIAYLIW